MLKCGIVGFGGLGKAHFGNLKKLAAQGLAAPVAICDVEPAAFATGTATNVSAAKTFNLGDCSLYTDFSEMLAKEQMDLLVSATPSYLHSQVALGAFAKGLHVFSEKPMALTPADTAAMLAAAREADRLLMIGQCLRYWPEYQALKDLVEKRTYGQVIHGEFWRYGSTPRWSWQDWYLDEAKSGGAPLDLHIHDVDMIHWLFGVPQWVCALCSHVDTAYDSISCLYSFNGTT
jgi:predicted dehydrogenase